MIKFKGRLGFSRTSQQSGASMLSDATTGYVRRFQNYIGAATSLDEHTSADNIGATSRVVLGVINGLKQYHPRLYVDNYYTSPQLFLHLYNKEWVLVELPGTHASIIRATW